MSSSSRLQNTLSFTRSRAQVPSRAPSIVPGLAVILVGDNAASTVYVANKVRACGEVGIQSFKKELPATTETDELIATIEELSRDPGVHGILVQLPLPAHIDMRRVLH